MLRGISNFQGKVALGASRNKIGVLHLINNNFWNVIISCQLNLEFDTGWIIFGFAQIVLAFATSLGSFNHQIFVPWKKILT